MWKYQDDKGRRRNCLTIIDDYVYAFYALPVNNAFMSRHRWDSKSMSFFQDHPVLWAREYLALLAWPPVVI